MQTGDKSMHDADTERLLRNALGDALRRTWHEMEELGDEDGGSAAIRDAFIRSLRKALAGVYRGPEFAVFGGKPGRNESRSGGVPTGIEGWRRWEYLYDVAVVEVDETSAARATDGQEKRKLRYIKRAVWLIESELSNSGTEVSKDVSKLRIGHSTYKLFLGRASTDHKPEEWRKFIGRLAKGCDGYYLGLLPSYASGRKLELDQWKKHLVEIMLYHCCSDGTTQKGCGVVSATSTQADDEP
jgi:hypothetical protein